ncbi:MAG: biopolymer transporter Tol [Oscillatoriales cyanobacterium]|nr:MAG: biopolymer transporter Tol [Oscillatoriales cyanobacterium]
MSITTFAQSTLQSLTQSAVVALTAALLSACGNSGSVSAPLTLNSRYADEQPSLSGDGRMLAFVSNRNGDRQILLFDLQQRRFIDLPHLNRRDAIAEQPSLSYTGRYLVYLASDYARPEIELYDRATGQVQLLSQGYRGWVRSPHISPDGRFVVFESGARGQWDIELLDRGINTELDLPEGRSPNSPPSPAP